MSIMLSDNRKFNFGNTAEVVSGFYKGIRGRIVNRVPPISTEPAYEIEFIESGVRSRTAVVTESELVKIDNASVRT